MAWVSVHDNVIGKKLRKFAKKIDCTQEEALGVLVTLWLWGLNNADKDGRLISADKDDVREAFSAKFVSKLKSDIIESLIETGWLEEPEPGSLYIHDWSQWQVQWYKAMERRERDAKRKAESRRSKSESEEDHVPEPEPNPVDFAEPASPPAPPKPASRKTTNYNVAFEEFWSVYPRQVGKGEAYKKYQARRKDGFSDEQLIEAARKYAAECRRKGTEKDYIKHPKTFLSDSLPFIDYLPKREEQVTVTSDGNPFSMWGDENN